MSFQILGSNTNGTTEITNDYAVIGKFYCETSGRATHLYIYNQYTCGYKYAVYEDVGGTAPGDAVYVQNSVQTITGNATVTWRSLAIPEPFMLTGGNWYWLAVAANNYGIYRNNNNILSYSKNVYPLSSYNYPNPGTLSGWSSYGKELSFYLLGDEVVSTNDSLTNKTFTHLFNPINYLKVTDSDNLVNTSLEFTFSDLTFGFNYEDNLINTSIEHTFTDIDFAYTTVDSLINSSFEYTFNVVDWSVNQDVFDNLINTSFEQTFNLIPFVATLGNSLINKSFTVSTSDISDDIVQVDFSLRNAIFGTSFGRVNDFINNSSASFKLISSSYNGRTSADAEALESFDMGAFMWGQTRDIKFRIGNDSVNDITFGILAESSNSDIIDNVRFSINGKDWNSSLTVTLKPNQVSDTIKCKLMMPTTGFIDEGTFLLNILREI